jgi:hypothetical protein
MKRGMSAESPNASRRQLRRVVRSRGQSQQMYHRATVSATQSLHLGITELSRDGPCGIARTEEAMTGGSWFQPYAVLERKIYFENSKLHHTNREPSRTAWKVPQNWAQKPTFWSSFHHTSFLGDEEANLLLRQQVTPGLLEFHGIDRDCASAEGVRRLACWANASLTFTPREFRLGDRMPGLVIKERYLCDRCQSPRIHLRPQLSAVGGRLSLREN